MPIKRYHCDDDDDARNWNVVIMDLTYSWMVWWSGFLLYMHDTTHRLATQAMQIRLVI